MNSVRMQRSTVLATVRRSRGGVRVGSWSGALYLGIWNPYVGAAYGVLTAAGELIPFPYFGNDTRSYMFHIDSSVDGLHNDVINDANGKRTELCLADLDAKGIVVDAAAVLRCAGIAAPTSDQIKRFGACVTEKKSAGDKVSRAVLAQCADTIAGADGMAPKNKAHTDAEWRRAFSYWMQDWRSYMNKNNIDVPGYRPTKEELDTWYAQLEGKGGWRDLFVQLGGRTINPAAPAPKDVPLLGGFSIPSWVIWLGGAALVAFVLVQARALLPHTAAA